MARPEPEQRSLPARPYRDSAIVYGVMAVILIVLAGVTGGSLVKAAVAAIIFWLGATGWSWWKFRRRIRERELAAAATEIETPDTEGVARSAVARTNGTRTGRATGNGNGAERGEGAGGAEQ